MRSYRKNVSDEEVRLAGQHNLKELMKYVRPRVKTEPDMPAGPTKPATESKKEARTISREQREFLQDIFEKPDLSVTSRAARLGLSAYKMNSLKKVLVDRGCIEQFSVNLGQGYGGNVAMLELLPKGYGYLGLKPVVRPENVSREHWWWQKKLCGHSNDRGVEAEVEKSRSGKQADVCIYRDGKEIAVEIEMSPKNALPNILNDLEAGFERVVCCCKNTRTAAEVKNQFKKSKDYEKVKDRVEIKVLTELKLVKDLEV